MQVGTSRRCLFSLQGEGYLFYIKELLETLPRLNPTWGEWNDARDGKKYSMTTRRFDVHREVNTATSGRLIFIGKRHLQWA